MKKLPTVTVGVPAFQAERNIRNLLTSISQQQTDVCKIEKILVNSDGSTDRTTEMARTVKDPRLTVFESKRNQGYAATLGFLIKKSKSDVFVTLNDDIIIEQDDTVDRLISPFIEDPSVTFVSGNIVPLPPKTFIGRCIHASFFGFMPIRYKLRGGNNMYSCDGKILALRRDVASRIYLDDANTATVDIFLYFENLRLGGTYRFAPEAKVLFRLPETVRDWRNLQYRTIRAHRLMKKKYPTLYDNQAKIPFSFYCRCMVPIILKYPVESFLFKLFINAGFFQTTDKQFKRWTLTESTKHLLGTLLVADATADHVQQALEAIRV